jgi:hypothetical protein
MAKVPLRREEVELIRTTAERVARRMNGTYEVDETRVEIVDDPAVESIPGDPDKEHKKSFLDCY